MRAAEVDSEILKKRLAAAEQHGQGLRAAYECLVEALINVTIKVANVEAERDSFEAERDSFEAERDSFEAERDSLSSRLADTEEKLRVTEQQCDILASQLSGAQLRLEAVLQSSSWRITRPLRRVVRILADRKQ